MRSAFRGLFMKSFRRLLQASSERLKVGVNKLPIVVWGFLIINLA